MNIVTKKYNILMFNHQFRLRFAAGNRNKTVHDFKKRKKKGWEPDHSPVGKKTKKKKNRNLTLWKDTFELTSVIVHDFHK